MDSPPAFHYGKFQKQKERLLIALKLRLCQCLLKARIQGSKAGERVNLAKVLCPQANIFVYSKLQKQHILAICEFKFLLCNISYLVTAC